MGFNDNLKSIRCGAGITQKSLSEKIGVTTVTIGNWERGVRQPSFELLSKLADALNTSIDALLGRGHQSFEIEFLQKYRKLDEHGRRLVALVCDTELERVDKISSKVIEFHSKEHVRRYHRNRGRYIPFYLTPPAAGVSASMDSEDCEMLLVDESVPDEADYAVRISGDSMKPYIQDGETVFVKETQELYDGDIAIFCVDGAMYCKQYYVDKENNLHLLSANPRRVNTNICIDVESTSSVKCCGKVLLDAEISLPEYFEED